MEKELGYQQTIFVRGGDNKWLPVFTVHKLLPVSELKLTIPQLCSEGTVSKFVNIGIAERLTFILDKIPSPETMTVHVACKIRLHDLAEMPDELPF